MKKMLEGRKWHKKWKEMGRILDDYIEEYQLLADIFEEKKKEDMPNPYNQAVCALIEVKDEFESLERR